MDDSLVIEETRFRLIPLESVIGNYMTNKKMLWAQRDHILKVAKDMLRGSNGSPEAEHGPYGLGCAFYYRGALGEIKTQSSSWVPMFSIVETETPLGDFDKDLETMFPRAFFAHADIIFNSDFTLSWIRNTNSLEIVALALIYTLIKDSKKDYYGNESIIRRGMDQLEPEF